MSGSQRRLWVGIVAVIATAMSAAAVAWACTPTADMTAGPGSGAPGTQVTFTGTGFDRGIVELRMDSTTSAPLATVQGPSFSVTLTVPETSPGYHTFGAVGYNSEGVAVGEASVPFEVTGASAEPAQSVAPTVPQSSGRPATRPATGAVERVSPSPRSQADRRSSDRDVAPSAGTPAVAAPGADELPAPAPRTAVPDRADAVRSGQGARTARTPDSARPLGGIRRIEPGAQEPARAAAPQDLWATSSNAGDEQNATPGGQLAIGAGLLAFGLVALFGGFAVAELRRRRALAGARRRP